MDGNGLVCEEFSHGEVKREVYSIGSGPAVILMHELGGLAPITLDLGHLIAGKGYTVFMPMFFGRFRQDSARMGLMQICTRSEFVRLALGLHSDLTDWVRHLARWAGERTEGEGVAAIGMCATGGLVFGMLLEDDVVAGVASQPSMPFTLPFCSRLKKKSLGLSEEELELVAGRPLLALRFKRDVLCPPERFVTVRKVFGEGSTKEIPEHGDYDDADPPIKRFAHAVLTYDRSVMSAHPTNQAFQAVLDFLDQHLTTSS